MEWNGMAQDAHCSPACLSHSIVTSWIDTRTVKSEKAALTILFDKYLPPCLEKLRSEFKTITPVPEVTAIQTVLSLLECFLTPKNVPADSPREQYELFFVFACIWAFGMALYQDQVQPQDCLAPATPLCIPPCVQGLSVSVLSSS